MIQEILVFFIYLAGFILLVSWFAFADWVEKYTSTFVSFVLGLGVPVAILITIASL
jgi:hypothetical protein